MTRTGIPATAAEQLARVWAEQLDEEKKETVGKVVDLELPEPASERLPAFPDRPGWRNCWVRHRGSSPTPGTGARPRTASIPASSFGVIPSSSSLPAAEHLNQSLITR
ncbi:hypothetical protein [Streptomyces sp. NPDC088812]|uniref:hypothetical protein n=1 Tax=Streptomyces sp. NPDC088812 TaxID=3365905 RepID=UPI00382034EC